MPDHLITGWGVAKALAMTLMTALVWQFKRFAAKVDRLEEIAANGVTREELAAAVNDLKSLQRECKNELDKDIETLERHITERMIDHCSVDARGLRKEKFAELQHGFIGYIEDQDEELNDDK